MQKVLCSALLGFPKHMAFPLPILERSLLLSRPLTSWFLFTLKSFAWLNYLMKMKSTAVKSSPPDLSRRHREHPDYRVGKALLCTADVTRISTRPPKWLLPTRLSVGPRPGLSLLQMLV